MKKLLSFLIVFSCVFAVKGVTFTDGDFTFSDEQWYSFGMTEVSFPAYDNDSWNNPVIYVSKYNGSSEHVAIPSEVSHEGVTYSVSHVGPQAFKDNSKIKSVELGSVKYIGRKAFYGCRNLSSIDLWRCTEIDGWAFTSTGLTNVSLSLKYLGDFAFFNCTKLTDLELYMSGDPFNGGVRAGVCAFASCPSLKNITGITRHGDLYILSDYMSTSRVMFVSRDATTADLRGYIVDNQAIEYCSQLESVVLDRIPTYDVVAEAGPEFEDFDNRSGVFNIFKGCDSLKKVKVYKPQESPGYRPTILPYGCHLYVPFGMSDNYKTSEFQICEIGDYQYYRDLTDDDIIEYGVKIKYNSDGRVCQYKEADGVTSISSISSGIVLEDNIKIGIEPYSYAYIKSVTLNGSDISSMLHEGIIDFSAEGITSGVVEIQFGSYPHIQLFTSDAGKSKIYDDGMLINNREYIIGDKEHCILIVPEEGYYVSEIKLTNSSTTSLTPSEANTVIVTPGEKTQDLYVKFKKYPQVSVRTSGAGEVLYRGESLRRDGIAYVVNTGKELDFYIVSDCNASIDKVMWNDEDVTDRVENRHLRVNAETRSELSVNFVKSGYATLTVAALGQHSVTTTYREGEAPTVTLTPVEGHTLHSLTLNGESLEIKDDNTFVLPSLYGDNVLNVVYVESVESGIDNQEVSNIKITVFNHTISILNKPDDALVEVYDINGSMIAETCESTVAIDGTRNIVIVKVGGRAYKVAL